MIFILKTDMRLVLKHCLLLKNQQRTLLDQKHFHQDEREHLVNALNAWTL